MADFSEILKQLHADNEDTTDNDSVIEITSQRTFNIPSDYNLVLGYAGDVNSQVVTFKIPSKHDGHILKDCQHKRIKWKNTADGAEGYSKLTVLSDGSDSSWLASWQVPPAATQTAGSLEVSLVVFDVINDKIAFAWNTVVYTGFKIGQSVTTVTNSWSDNEHYWPAKDETLVIDADTRAIIAPRGFNGAVANFGDIGVSAVYFEANKKIRGIDLMDERLTVFVSIKMNNKQYRSKIEKTNIRPSTINEDRVLITWQLPDWLTSGLDSDTHEPLIGKFSISLTFAIIGTVYGVTKTIKKWTTAIFNNLAIGESMLVTDPDNVEVENDLETEVLELIDNYFVTNEFIIGSQTED